MLLVETKIGPSSVEGIGLFAGEFISKGTPVWKFAPGFDLEIDPNDLNQLSAPARKQFLRYSYLDPKTKKYEQIKQLLKQEFLKRDWNYGMYLDIVRIIEDFIQREFYPELKVENKMAKKRSKNNKGKIKINEKKRKAY